MRLRLKSYSCALDSRTWLENAIWGLKPNTVIARFSSVALQDAGLVLARNRHQVCESPNQLPSKFVHRNSALERPR